jgi:hypothetical protein
MFRCEGHARPRSVIIMGTVIRRTQTFDCRHRSRPYMSIVYEYIYVMSHYKNNDVNVLTRLTRTRHMILQVLLLRVPVQQKAKTIYSSTPLYYYLQVYSEYCTMYCICVNAHPTQYDCTTWYNVLYLV